jgi:hypothetical protein
MCTVGFGDYTMTVLMGRMALLFMVTEALARQLQLRYLGISGRLQPQTAEHWAKTAQVAVAVAALAVAMMEQMLGVLAVAVAVPVELPHQQQEQVVFRVETVHVYFS